MAARIMPGAENPIARTAKAQDDPLGPGVMATTPEIRRG
jgi:hypothetical protein